MDKAKAYLIGTHQYSFRSGEPAKITGVVMVKPSGKHEIRPCYEVKFDDGFIDYVALCDTGNYKIVSFGDIVTENISLK